MSMLHSRCLSIESLLRGRINDLESLVDSLREDMRIQAELATGRERALIDRLIAVMNPLAGRAIAEIDAAANVAARSTKPADRPPALRRTNTIPVPLPGQGRRPPVLTPTAAGYRPAVAAARTLEEEVRATAAAEGGEGEEAEDAGRG